MQLKLTDSKLPFAPLLLIAPFFLWGTAMVAMKGVMPHTTPLFVAVVRLLPAGVLVLLAAALMGKQQPAGWKAWLWISLFALVDGTLFQGLAVAILCLWLFQEKIGFWGWLGLVIGVIGISLIGLPDGLILGLFHPESVQVSAGIESVFQGGEWLMLLAALSMAVGTVLVRWVCRYVDPVVATGWHMILGGLPLLAISAATESGQFVNIDLSGWMALGYSTVFGSAIAYGLFFYFASSGSLTSLSSLTFLTPIFALLFGNLLLGEVLNPVQSMGVGLTLVSIYLINQRDTLAEKLGKGRKGAANSEEEVAGLLESSELDSVELPVQLRVSELESEV
ncbi:MAG: DMT family transporter [Oscillatoriales cyanobacterium]|nr:MAG: DMT family transporter [Oscillatoriales cyanobacterium]